jgi:nucleoside-diphosphate-sugar epimerase
MKVIITGATGMVGEGVLLHCIDSKEITEVLMVNRRPYDLKHSKLKELIVKDFLKLDENETALKGYDACFFCAGISSVGLKEDEYTKITYDTTLNFATILAKLNQGMVFTFVSGAATDSSEKGSLIWARVKGKTENDLMKLPFKKEYNFRPDLMKPVKGQKNVKTFFRILIPILSPFFASKVLTLIEVGQAMINAVNKGYDKQVLEVSDIKKLAKV